MTNVYQTHIADLDLFQDCGAEFGDLFPHASIFRTLEAAKEALQNDVLSMAEEEADGEPFDTPAFEWKQTGRDEWECAPSESYHVLIVYRSELQG